MIRKFIIRLLRFLLKLQIIGKVISFTYIGEGLSLNSFYSNGHWSNRNKLKNTWREKFDKITRIANGTHFFEKYYIVIFYNSRHDVDNVVGMEKIFTDSLKTKIVPDDDKRYYKGMLIFYDDTLPNNTFEFVLIEAK